MTDRHEWRKRFIDRLIARGLGSGEAGVCFGLLPYAPLRFDSSPEDLADKISEAATHSSLEAATLRIGSIC